MSIKNMSIDSRPRERLELVGLANLSNAELLAIIIGSGSKEKSAIAIANELLEKVGSIRKLSRLNLNNIKIKGFMAIYFHYYYLFKRYKQNPMNYKLTPQMRADLIKMNIYSNEAKLLSKYNIQNSDDLLNLKQNKSKEIRDLSITREGLWYRRSKEKDEDKKVEFCNKIAELNSQIEELSKEVELCRDIQARIPKMKENLKEQKKFEDDERKQERENEYGRRKYFRNF